MKNTRFWLLALLLLAFTGLFAQDDEDSGDDKQNSPLKAMKLHLDNLQPGNYDVEKAARVIKMKDRDRAQDIAVKIKQVLDGKTLRVIYSSVPDETKFRDSLTGQRIFVPFPRKMPVIYLEKGRGKNWFYSQETVNAIDDIHAEIYPMGSDVLLKNMPGVGQWQFLGLALWQYLSILIMFLLAVLVHKILQRVLNPIIKLIAGSRLKGHTEPELLIKVARMLSLVLIFYFLIKWLPSLLLPIDYGTFASLALHIMLAVFVIYFGLRFLDLVMFGLRKVAQSTDNTMDDQFMPIIYHGMQIIISISGIFWVLSLLNVNVTALIAGLSIGGLAVALAAQDTVKNLIGSVMIFVDRPFVVGDFINAGEVVGVVEEVGFRSTRVRSVDTSIYSIPNGKLVDLVVNNMGERVARRYKMEIGVTYDTPPELIDVYIDGLRQLVMGHPNTAKDRTIIHLNNLGGSSINIMVLTYFHVKGYPEEMQAIEEVLRGILRLTDELGVRFAFPSQALYIEDFPEKKSLVPTYNVNRANLEAATAKILSEYKKSIGN